MPDAPARLVEALADRYRIERELGAGGMATVYLAEDLKHHRKVAIKVLRPELSAVLETERFLKEIELTASIVCRTLSCCLTGMATSRSFVPLRMDGGSPSAGGTALSIPCVSALFRFPTAR